LVPGRSYLLETVVRTVKMGHLFTQGTADSNEVWLDVVVSSGGRVIGRSGGLAPDGEVDPWAHFVNIYMLDRHGNRIDRRNAQDIFVPLYNHQIPPGAADVLHYRLDLPAQLAGEITVDVALRYRKFDTRYLRYVYGEDYVNDLPMLTLATDRVVFPVGDAATPPQATPDIPLWQRWNDYGIGLLLKGGKSKGQLAQAEAAFQQVEALGRADGPLNLARVYLEQGTVQDQAIAALERAAAFDPPAPSWSVAWFTGLVNKQNGFLDEAISSFRGIINASSSEMQERGFDFSKDYRLLDELGQTLFERAKQERGEARRESRDALLREAVVMFERALEIDSEDAVAHYNLDLVYRLLGDEERAARHRALYSTYKADDNARDRAVAIARRNDPAANHAAEAIVIYDLDRDGAVGLGEDAAVALAQFQSHLGPAGGPPVVAASAGQP
jgi:tetratricopeptide (TPR) repeat protein